ncbi:MAG: phenylalanine--tRNA ligase subunit beta [Bacteroidetes bacterium]|nr:phenylalanine--tRNA ligase subunit beta [Bacteroidota bacterium]
MTISYNWLMQYLPAHPTPERLSHILTAIGLEVESMSSFSDSSAQGDWIYEIGLTPNRMDAMSHLGVARDVLAYLNFHDKKNDQLILPYPAAFKTPAGKQPIQIAIENKAGCRRYAGLLITGVTVQESPVWLQDRLKSIGLKPINNIVDITNFVLHETGQPLHAFDADAITGNKVIIRNAQSGETFITLDEKERKLSEEDLLIANENQAMCIAGVFGGFKSGVKNTTTSIFLESAVFDATSIRKTSFRHQLRTDAATRFEKGVDISNTVNVLKRAALLIQELGGGTISSDITDIYPEPAEKKSIALRFHYLKKISGKNYHPDHIKKILLSLGFEWIKESVDEIWVAPPFSKTDIHHPADIVEEIMRIDGLDQVEIPTSITMSPSSDTGSGAARLKEKISQYLAGAGFREILTNSIVNSEWYDEATLSTSVKMLNNLSADLNLMRPSMLESGLQCIAFNLNRKNQTLPLFEFGKTYHQDNGKGYREEEHLMLYATGKKEQGWQQAAQPLDYYFLKGIAERLLQQCGIAIPLTQQLNGHKLSYWAEKKCVLELYNAPAASKKIFDLKQEVAVADFHWANCVEAAQKIPVRMLELPRFPAVERDLSLVLSKNILYSQVAAAVDQCKLQKLQQVRLFDVFENEKLGNDKKSMALNFRFVDEEKTLTDSETDGMMQQIIGQLEKELQAQIRK